MDKTLQNIEKNNGKVKTAQVHRIEEIRTTWSEEIKMAKGEKKGTNLYTDRNAHVFFNFNRFYKAVNPRQESYNTNNIFII